MKECCQDIDDIARESDSEIESLIDHSTEEDIMSITEDDIYMYNMIFHPCHAQDAETTQETPLILYYLTLTLKMVVVLLYAFQMTITAPIVAAVHSLVPSVASIAKLLTHLQTVVHSCMYIILFYACNCA